MKNIDLFSLVKSSILRGRCTCPFMHPGRRACPPVFLLSVEPLASRPTGSTSPWSGFPLGSEWRVLRVPSHPKPKLGSVRLLEASLGTALCPGLELRCLRRLLDRDQVARKQNRLPQFSQEMQTAEPRLFSKIRRSEHVPKSCLCYRRPRPQQTPAGRNESRRLWQTPVRVRTRGSP